MFHCMSHLRMFSIVQSYLRLHFTHSLTKFCMLFLVFLEESLEVAVESVDELRHLLKRRLCELLSAEFYLMQLSVKL
jgi:hypothetical protein